MISTFAFLSLLLIFVRVYSILSLLFLGQNRTRFAERVTILTLLFEVLVIFLYTFFSNSFKFLLPPVFMLIKTSKFFIFKNFSLLFLIYSIINIILILTFNSQSIFKFINRFFVGVILLTNIIYGFLLIM
ncbi:MAG: hypothetical protein D8B40_04090 [Leptotrichia sp.]|nr:hypothetical protein BCB68_09210 [Leptotrichia sp. oral taxon 498]RKW34894.1 MAG: hypothetical protein D8B40_04090 [Leptotrichia sp.]